jgi:hypothetical protein
VNFPAWMYRWTGSEFQSTLCAEAEYATQMLRNGWSFDPKSFGVDVVPLPCELLPNGEITHHARQADANGNYAYGLRPTKVGIASFG